MNYYFLIKINFAINLIYFPFLFLIFFYETLMKEIFPIQAKQEFILKYFLIERCCFFLIWNLYKYFLMCIFLLKY